MAAMTSGETQQQLPMRIHRARDRKTTEENASICACLIFLENLAQNCVSETSI